MLNKLLHSNPESCYTIFTGVFEVNDKSEFLSLLGNDYVAWDFKVPHYKGENVLGDLSQVYSESFVNALFDMDNIQRYTYHIHNQEPISIKALFQSDAGNTKEILSGIPEDIQKIAIRINFLDIYLFPFNFVICSYKIEYLDAGIRQIPYLNYLLREFSTLDAIDFFSSKIPLFKSGGLQKYGNKLKAYTVVEHDLELTKDEQFHLLYDIGTCSDIGSASHEGTKKFLYPSEEYYNKLIVESKISVFENWSALCLFDSVTYLIKKPLNNYTFENAYYNLLYVGTLFLKFLLHRINKNFSNNISLKEAQELEKWFINIDRVYNLKYISFNFLPQLVYEQLRYGLNIEAELRVLSDRIERYYQKATELKEAEEILNERRLNQILTIIAILSVFDAIATAAQWIYNLIYFKKMGDLFLILNIVISILVAAIILFVLKVKKDK